MTPNRHLCIFGTVVGSVALTLDILTGSTGWALLSAGSVAFCIWDVLRQPAAK